MKTVVDVFCGAGGLTHGFVREGFNVTAGIDIDTSCQYAYEQNNDGAKFIHADIENVTAKDILALYPKSGTRILVGCAPCQPFSTHTNKQREKNEQWKLVSNFADLILEVQPDIASMENVPRLRTFKEGAVFNDFIKRLESTYHITWYVVNCADYGVPQQRERLVVFLSKFGPIDIIEKTHDKNTYRTVADAIGGLPELRAGETYDADPLHKACRLADINMKRIQQSKPGGTWLDWDEDLLLDCHKRKSGEYYKSVYGRMAWDEPSPTITTQAYSYGTGRFGHPQQNRALTLREMAILQSFPENYEFVDPTSTTFSIKGLGIHIGNAVPVDLARVIARSIRKHLESIHV
jgi:DNA (cytosine-5)-methyltransferase 1